MGCKSAKKVKEEPKYRKGLWSPEEDFKLRNYVLKHGHDCWSSVPINAGLQRNGKSCRLRWINYLRPGLKRGMFSSQEEEIIVSLHSSLGNKWSRIAQQLPGRTDNEIKNYWHTYLKKKVQKLQEHEATNKACNIAATSSLNSDSISDDLISLQVQSQNINTTSIGINDHNYVPQIEASKNILPNVMFAEWLLNDSFATSFSNYSSTLAINNCFNGHDAFEDHIPNLQDDDLFNNEEVTLDQKSIEEVINSSLISDVSAGNGYQNTNLSPVSDRSIGSMITSQFTFTDQSALGNDHVHDFGSSDFIFYDDFNI